VAVGVSTDNASLVELGDLDELTRQVDRLCRGEDWDGLVDLRDRCRAALERGKQLWPVASHAEYRLALEAPGAWAGRVLVPGTGRLALGPLPEVAAATHRWAELAPHLEAGPLLTVTAHERVVRGEDVRAESRLDPGVLDLPAVLLSWEPDPYPTAEYESHQARFPPPDLPPRRPEALGSAGTRLEDPDSTDALLELTRAWTAESDGRAEAVAVRGDARDAIAALGPHRVRIAPLDPSTALAWMAWAGASGGAYGRRRGMAAGRFGTWWALAALAGAVEDWPLTADDIGEIATDLHWYAWDAWEPDTGWRFHLAVEDPAEGLGWAVAATDAA
jgi:hypothetical protein